MESSIKIVMTGICAVLAAEVLKRAKSEYALFISLAFAVGAGFLIISIFSKMMTSIKRLFDVSGLNTAYWEILIKSIGIAYITQMGAALCEDAEERAISKKIEMVGQVIILLYALPIMEGIFDVITQLLEKAA